MSTSDIIQIISIVCTSLLSVIAIIISVLTLRKSSKAIIESSRANIMFYIDTLTGGQNYIVLKNFGNSSGKILNIDISPNIEYSKLSNDLKLSVITEFSNITLAPQQVIKSSFDFSHYPDKIFNVKLSYETLGKTYNEQYTINISYIDSIDYRYKANIDVSDEKECLLNIGNQIMRLTERF